ncbi:ribonuclease P protein component 1 [Candidatus Bathyarchaeota archaeon]|nr:ribonuclease P protein component 1 [Candidatus Bathyarchaeota archaeon]
MRVTPSLVKDEFIGLKVMVADSPNRDLIGISGTVIKETRNTFIVLNGNKKKTVAKNQTTFHFTLADATIVEVDGHVLSGRPEERIKKRTRRLW